ncbi:hypothetical protein BDN72DRAFT_956181 [Pluteus cervinus]|uniref:Uncharacterized protein n=1 Tax=Pluteus cervinus TaxID=181527 RepID=A0ACD3B826_9AGAR|nr:hypothetical protein BDN72DRAFT_956181 [Pluteus cervinus]
MKFLSALALTLCTSVALATPLESRSGTILTQAEVEARFRPYNITASSTGGCITRSISTCTSYDGFYSGTVNGVISLRQGSGASGLVVTGGTEVGHASSSVYSHSNGYKADLRHVAALDNYIKGQFTRIGDRSDGYPQWQSPSGNLFCDEGSHWDITIY